MQFVYRFLLGGLIVSVRLNLSSLRRIKWHEYLTRFLLGGQRQHCFGRLGHQDRLILDEIATNARRCVAEFRLPETEVTKAQGGCPPIGRYRITMTVRRDLIRDA
jgi:hypothetical protein